MSNMSNNHGLPNQPLKPGQKPPARPSVPAPKTASKTNSVAKSILGALKPGGPANMQAKPGIAKPGPTTTKVSAQGSKAFKK
jgi:hypothetical protein